MNIVGLDPSLRSFGFASSHSAGVWKPKTTGVERLVDLRNSVVTLCCGDTPADVVCIEDYAYSRGDAHAHELGELGGVVRVALTEAGVRWVAVNPASLKKYATGKGNASKEQVLAAGVQRSRFAFQTTDECDAWWLRCMALDHYGAPLLQMPISHRVALEAVPWPELAVAA